MLAADPNEMRIAKEAARQLAALTEANGASARLRFQADGEPGEAVTIPASVLRMLTEILNQMAKGNGVKLVPVPAELTPLQAAELLDIPVPSLLLLLDEGRIASHMVGTHRRVRLQDLLAYKETADQARREALEELSALDQELGFGY